MSIKWTSARSLSHLQLPSQCVLCHAPLPRVHSRPGLPLACVSLFYSEWSYTAAKPLCRLCLTCLLSLLLGSTTFKRRDLFILPDLALYDLHNAPGCASIGHPPGNHQVTMCGTRVLCKQLPHSFLDPCLLPHLYISAPVYQVLMGTAHH